MTSNATLPTVITHNYDPRFGAFRNICNLTDSAAEAILEEIRAQGHRGIKANYLRRRREVEDWLISERRSKLGETRLHRPIYFFLGDFADGLDRSRPQSHVLPLAAFPAAVLTFTFPDSLASLPLAMHEDLSEHRRDYHGHVFSLAEIRHVVGVHGLPDKGAEGDRAVPHDRFIEVQVWDDRPINRWLTGGLWSARAGPPRQDARQPPGEGA